MKQYIVIVFSVLFFKDSFAMVTRPATTRTLYQPTTRQVWEDIETIQPSTTHPTSYRSGTPRYFGTSTAPRTLFTTPTTAQPTLGAAFTRWRQQAPRTLWQQPSISTHVFETQRPLVQPTTRTFTTSPTRQSWSDWFSSWWKKKPEEPKESEADRVYRDAMSRLSEINNLLKDGINISNENSRLIDLLESFPQEHINMIYSPKGLKSVDDLIISNVTLLKLLTNNLRPFKFLSDIEIYGIIKNLIARGASPQYNPHYTSEKAMEKLKNTNDSAFNLQRKYQYPPIWIAIMKSNAPVLSALLNADVKITDETAEQVSNMSFTPEAKLTLFDIALKNNNKEIIYLLRQQGYGPKLFKKEQNKQNLKTHQESQPTMQKEKLAVSTDKLILLIPDQMLSYMQIKGSEGDYAGALGLNANPSTEEIKSAVRMIIKTFHPDVVSTEHQKAAHEISDLTLIYREKLLNPQPELAMQYPPEAEDLFKDLFR